MALRIVGEALWESTVHDGTATVSTNAPPDRTNP